MSSKVIDWAALVKEAWGPAYFEPDVVYIQSNGRESKDSRGQGGIYTVSIFNALLTEDQRAGLAPNYLLQEDGSRLGNG